MGNALPSGVVIFSLSGILQWGRPDKLGDLVVTTNAVEPTEHTTTSTGGVSRRRPLSPDEAMQWHRLAQFNGYLVDAPTVSERHLQTKVGKADRVSYLAFEPTLAKYRFDAGLPKVICDAFDLKQWSNDEAWYQNAGSTQYGLPQYIVFRGLTISRADAANWPQGAQMVATLYRVIPAEVWD